MGSKGTEFRPYPLRCIADTAIRQGKNPRHSAAHKRNYGAAKSVDFHGIHYNRRADDSAMLLLLDLDASSLRHRLVESGTLFLHCTRNADKLQIVSVSTVATDWKEGSGTGKKAEQRGGGATANWTTFERHAWDRRQSEIIDAAFEMGHTLCHTAPVRHEPDGWIAIEIPGPIVQALVHGGSAGLALMEEKGQTEVVYRISMRESDHPPYLVANAGRNARRPPSPPRGLQTAPAPKKAGLRTGAVRLQMQVSPEVARVEVRYRIGGAAIAGGGKTQTLERARTPWPPRRGGTMRLVVDGLPPAKPVEFLVRAIGPGGAASSIARVRGTTSPAKVRPPALRAASPEVRRGSPPERGGRLRVWAYGECEQAHPVTGNLLEEVGAKRYGGRAAGGYRRGNPVWNGADPTVTIAGCRNEILGFHLLIESVRPKLTGIRVRPKGLTGPGGFTIPPANAQVYHEWYVNDGDWAGELCVPLGPRRPFAIPDPHNRVPGQRNQSLLVDLLIPRDAPAGTYRGAIAVTADGVAPFDVPVELTVWQPVLPDTLSFNCELNAYSPLADNDDYHRMAHAHRTTLNVLPYSQNGTIKPAFAVPLAGTGTRLRVADWRAFDRHFGPRYDGSAFHDLPRAGVPLASQYLPHFENWPLPFREHYAFQPDDDSYPANVQEHFFRAGPIEKLTDKTYAEGWKAVVSDFVRHYRQKGWTRTEFQFYLNNKRGMGKGTLGFWNLDEPQHRDDWLALRYWGRLWKQATCGEKGVQFVYRGDISRPHWQRHWLDGMMDVLCVSGVFFQKNERCREMMARGMRFRHYGSLNATCESNLNAEAWPLKAYLAGADGMLPWNTIGSAENHTKPAKTAILVPPPPGSPRGTPVVCSVRLKALRRGQQDVEYLQLLAREKGYDLEQTTALVAKVLDLSDSATSDRFLDEAGETIFKGLTSERFALLRAAIASRLSE